MKLENLWAYTSLLGFSSACLPGHSASPLNAPGRFTRRSGPSPLGKTAIVNVRVFNGTCFTSPQTVVIDHDRLSACVDNITNTIDGSGRFLIPGLIDSHVHVADTEGLENITSYGVTTIMNMACRNYTQCDLLRGHAGLADFYTAGLGATGPNSTHARSMNLPPDQLVYPDSNATDLAKWVVGNNSDYYKITIETNGPSPEMQVKLVEGVHSYGMQVMAHASDIESYLQAISSRIDGIQHTPDDGNLTAAAVCTMKCQGQHVTPTMTIFQLFLEPPNPVVLQYLRGDPNPGNSSYSNVFTNVAAMYKANIPILAGTDAVGYLGPGLELPFGITLHQELQNLVKVGLTPAEAINAATRVPAKYHRLPDRGIIEHGMRADLILLKSDPLMDISNTLDIERIWVAGREYIDVAKMSNV